MDQTDFNSSERECSQVLLGSALAIAMVTGLTFLIALIMSHVFPSTSPSDLSEFAERSVPEILPEPTERRVFQVMVLLAPIIAILSYSIVRRLFPSLLSFSAFVKFGYLLLSMFIILWINSWVFCPNYMLSSGLGTFSFIFPIVTGVILIGYAYSHISSVRWVDAVIKKWFTLALITVLGICFLIAISFRVFDWKILYTNVSFDVIHHLNPVLYYASLAEIGTYTTNLGAPQYGFYSLYLKPVFSMLGLTIYSFSFVMTFLYLIGVIAVAVPIYRHLQNPYLKLLLVPVLCALQGALGQVSYAWIPFFQYYPIRFLIPALSVLMLYLVFRTDKENIRLCLAGIFSSALGFLVFWNFDSGITTIIAWLVFFLLFAAVETVKRRGLFNPSSFLCLVVTIMLALGIGIATIILIACDKSGISFERLFEIQRIFYLAGIMMLPMPLCLHPWMAVLGVYVVTLVLTLPIILRSGLNCSPKRMLVFYIAILGVGLFAYYQGRSHDMNLPGVTWPAILCCFLACDWCLSVDSTERRSAIRFLSMPFVVLCVSLTVALAWNFPWYLKRVMLLQSVFKNNESDLETMPFSYTIKWLSAYRNEPPGSVLIIHPAESLFYVESGLHPLPRLPSDQERYFFRRQEAEVQQIIQSGTVRHLFITPLWPKTPEYKRLLDCISSRYQLKETPPIVLLWHWTLKQP